MYVRSNNGYCTGAGIAIIPHNDVHVSAVCVWGGRGYVVGEGMSKLYMICITLLTATEK